LASASPLDRRTKLVAIPFSSWKALVIAWHQLSCGVHSTVSLSGVAPTGPLEAAAVSVAAVPVPLGAAALGLAPPPAQAATTVVASTSAQARFEVLMVTLVLLIQCLRRTADAWT
jgi:hypothetical protein